MSTSRESWSRRAEPHARGRLRGDCDRDLRRGVDGLHAGFYERSQIIDTPIYQRYGDAMANGQVPYRDFQLEYPPARAARLRDPVAAPLERRRPARLPQRVRGGDARVRGAGAAVHALDSAQPARRGRCGSAPRSASPRSRRCCSARSCSPASTSGRRRSSPARSPRSSPGGSDSARACSGSRVAAKIFPAVLVPLAAVWIWKRNGRRQALLCARDLRGGGARVLPAVLRAFAARGVGQRDRARRAGRSRSRRSAPAFLLVAHLVAGLGITMRSSHGSQNLAGAVPGRSGGYPDPAPGGRADRDLGLVRAGACRARAV